LRLERGCVPGNLVLDRRIKVAKRAGGFRRLAQDVAAPEAGEIIGGVVKAELMDSAMRAENLQVSMVEFGIHLHNGTAVIGIFVRIHRQTHSWIVEIKELKEGPKD
jgi:hypothetical protein